MNIQKIQDYYKQTAYEYRLVWNWKRNDLPAIHLGYYDDEATTHDQSLQRANAALAEWAGIKSGCRIVDAGCGMGQSSAWLAKNYGANVTGITVAPNQVEIAEKLIGKLGIRGVDFCVANYLDMPFEDNSVDIVWAIESVCYATDKLSFYKEAHRVLKPGGKLVMADCIRSTRTLNEKNEKLLKHAFAGWMIEDVDTIEEHLHHSENAGFINFRCRDVTANMLVSYRNLHQQTSRYLWLGWVLNKIGLLSQIRYNNLKYSSKHLSLVQKDLVKYGHICVTKP